jgi:hypothetical protein
MSDDFDEDFFKWYDSPATQERLKQAQSSPRDEAFSAALWAKDYVEGQQKFVFKLEDALGEIVLCKDGRVRKLRSVKPRVLRYDQRVTDTLWSQRTDCRGAVANALFIGGRILKSYADEV